MDRYKLAVKAHKPVTPEEKKSVDLESLDREEFLYELSKMVPRARIVACLLIAETIFPKRKGSSLIEDTAYDLMGLRDDHIKDICDKLLKREDFGKDICRIKTMYGIEGLRKKRVNDLIDWEGLPVSTQRTAYSALHEGDWSVRSGRTRYGSSQRYSS